MLAFSSSKQGFPIKGAEEESYNAKSIGNPIHFLFVEALTPEIAKDDDRDGKDGEDHRLLNGISCLGCPNHKESTNAVSNPAKYAVGDLSWEGLAFFCFEVNETLNKCSSEKDGGHEPLTGGLGLGKGKVEAFLAGKIAEQGMPLQETEKKGMEHKSHEGIEEPKEAFLSFDRFFSRPKKTGDDEKCRKAGCDRYATKLFSSLAKKRRIRCGETLDRQCERGYTSVYTPC